MRALPLLVLFAVVLLLLPLPAQAQGGWSVTVTPNIAINNGDNVTIGVKGAPATYVGVNIISPGTNDTLDLLYVVTGQDGTGSVDWPVPMDLKSGIYTVALIDGGEKVASATMEIIYDRLSYDEFLLRGQQEKLDQQTGQLVTMGNYVTSVHEQIMYFAVAVVLTAIIAAFIGYLNFRHFPPYLEWKAMKEKKNSRSTKNAKKVFYMLLNGSYPPDGAKFLFHPGQEKRMMLEVEADRKAKGLTEEKPYIVVHDGTATAGYRVFPMEGTLDMEDKEVDPVPESVMVSATEEEVVDLKAKKVKSKKSRRTTSRFTWLTGLLHWRARRKIKKYAATRRPAEDEEEEGEDAPYPVRRRRGTPPVGEEEAEEEEAPHPQRRRRPAPIVEEVEEEPIEEEVVPKTVGKARKRRPSSVRAANKAVDK